ncbi:hypothetical protein CYMTET_21856 [Cymbomonas tetramitiformis]|uniref:Uncharacterized protein n=1 Tax=Cymbomonas tetramitiformis TaxID=36881 RepID=A0AAE0G1C1_9CHLO|nr:hypothetical protein CYMTET_21856 [Cymbomonas tetramitiformis]
MANGRGLCLVALFGLASGSRFRYGALFWEPTGNVRGWVYGDQAQVEFTLRAAFRRDYDWGANFGERWAQTSSQHTQKTFYGNEYFYKEYITTNPGCDINAGANSEERALCFNCPTEVTGIDSTGIDATAVGCVNSKPFFDAAPNASVDLNVTLYDDVNNNGISGERFYIRFPPKKQDYPIEAEIVQCPDPFYCDILIQNEDGTWRDNREQTDLCSAYINNFDRDPNKCAPWAEVYGMYLGDDEGSSVEVEMSVTHVDHTGNPIVGNFLIGVGRFTHYYYENTATPYTAYFTGGDRIYECAEGVMDEYGRCLNDLDLMLNNNAEGRYRLESEVWIKSDIANRSPIISMIPILPVPRRQVPFERSKFQIAAYDPDGDTLRFRFGTTREMGGIMRSKSSAFPHNENDPPGPILPTVLKYGQFKCDTENKFYKKNQTCPTDRVPTRVPGVDEYSFDPDSGVPGLVEWTTHGYTYQWCPHKQDYCDDIRQGLYNMIVAVEDIPSNEVILQYTQEGVSPENAYMSKSIVDFMVYLYDGPMAISRGDTQSILC